MTYVPALRNANEAVKKGLLINRFLPPGASAWSSITLR